ncbi:MAG: hypothetical protein P8J50_15780 [Acidimicrobiales bacterium]|jgi:hypothetical protein|nr:hypothetical protein [Acidimicrobiales bacterium]
MRRLLIVIALLGASCGDAVDTTTADLDQEAAPFVCPVTVPPLPGLTPSSGHPPTPSSPDTVWFGTDELFTVLPIDGSHLPRKSVWWSADFDVDQDETPPLAVSYRQLDGEAMHDHPAPGTSA